MITERDKEILKSIIDFKIKYGYSPTVRELSKINIISKTTTVYHLKRLIKNEYIKVTPKISRSIIVLRPV